MGLDNAGKDSITNGKKREKRKISGSRFFETSEGDSEKGNQPCHHQPHDQRREGFEADT